MAVHQHAHLIAKGRAARIEPSAPAVRASAAAKG